MASEAHIFQRDLGRTNRSGNLSGSSSGSSVSSSTIQASPEPADEKPTQAEIDEKPWKYIGYNGYSAFLASDSDFCNFRRFDKLNIRIILLLQDEISQLEEELNDIDHRYSRRGVPDENNGSLRFDTRKERVKLVWQIRDRLEKYNRFVLQYMNLKNRATTTDKNRESLRNWLYNSNGAILSQEQDYIEKDDLFPLIPKDRSPLRRLFERSSRFRLSRLWKRPPATSELPTHVRENVHFYSDKRIDYL